MMEKSLGLGVQDPPGCLHKLCDLGKLCCLLFWLLICVLGVRSDLSSFCLSLGLSAKPLPTVNESPYQLVSGVEQWTWGGSALPWMWAPSRAWGCRSIEWQPLCSVSTLWGSVALCSFCLTAGWLLCSLHELLVFSLKPNLNLSAVEPDSQQPVPLGDQLYSGPLHFTYILDKDLDTLDLTF